MSDQDDGAAQPPVTPRSSLGSGALSYSSGSSMSPSTSSSGSQGSVKTSVSECLGAWLNYLQVLNSLCASGYRLTQTISALEQWTTPEIQPQLIGNQAGASTHPSNQMTMQFITAWDDLTRATAVETSTVKSHMITVLQDFITQPLTSVEQENEIQRIKDHNQLIVTENAQTMIQLQHEFCFASYKSFAPLICCLVCQAPVGYPHDPDCSLITQQPSFPKNQSGTADPRSQTPSPHFASNISKNDLYRISQDAGRPLLFDRGSGSMLSEHSGTLSGSIVEQTRGPSPHHDIRGPSPIQGFLDNIRGPLPNPGHLLTMKTPFYRGSRSPLLNYPLFPLNGQRRWSEAAAGEVKSESTMDAESQMRRWSMPWAASKPDRNTVTWHQTRIMPASKLAVPVSKASSDRSQSTTPESIWQSSVTSQDGLAEAIQLLSCRPSKTFQQLPAPIMQHTMGPPFIEEPGPSNAGEYGIWSARPNDRLPFIKFPRDSERPYDDNQPQPHPPPQ